MAPIAVPALMAILALRVVAWPSSTPALHRHHGHDHDHYSYHWVGAERQQVGANGKQTKSQIHPDGEYDVKGYTGVSLRNAAASKPNVAGTSSGQAVTSRQVDIPKGPSNSIVYTFGAQTPTKDIL